MYGKMYPTLVWERKGEKEGNENDKGERERERRVYLWLKERIV